MKIANSHPAFATVLLAFFCLSLACSRLGGGEFESNLKIAKSNSSTSAGAACNAALIRVVYSNSDAVAAMRKCKNGKTASQTVRGYLQVTSLATHRAVLKPKNLFSLCIPDVLNTA